METFLSVEEARHRILSDVPLAGAERIMLNEAWGRVLAQEIVAPHDSPAFDNSAMDGYAVRWADLSEDHTALRLVGEIAAGSVPSRALAAGEAMRIMTGAPVPEGADTVVIRENCHLDDDRVVIEARPSKGRGANIRLRGSNMARGHAVLEPGDRLGPGEIGLLASLQVATLSVYRRPVVAILTTGDELVEIDEPVATGKIVNSNAYMLRAAVEASGATAVVFPIVPDAREATERAFTKAVASADLVVSVGGVSMGDYDLVRDVLDGLCGGMHFWKIQMKPGKPLAFGTADDGTPLIGLPGNPLSSFVCFYQFVRPALYVAQGLAPEAATCTRIRARTSREIRSSEKRRQYVTGHLRREDGVDVFDPFPNQSSGNPLAMCRCNALAVVENGVGFVEGGQELTVEIL